MIRHFGIYTHSYYVEHALDEETLVNPYVALVSGALDYNSLEPAHPHDDEYDPGGELD